MASLLRLHVSFPLSNLTRSFFFLCKKILQDKGDQLIFASFQPIDPLHIDDLYGLCTGIVNLFLLFFHHYFPSLYSKLMDSPAAMC
jgi:hypothetical protein